VWQIAASLTVLSATVTVVGSANPLSAISERGVSRMPIGPGANASMPVFVIVRGWRHLIGARALRVVGVYLGGFLGLGMSP